ncbi:MAG: hypothetical protein ACYTF1_07935 [Planctomycetota bacterium]|jgi:hypothetical protein
MMKYFAGFGLLGFLVVMSIWMTVGAGGEDPGINIAMSYGNPGGGEIDMHVVVGVLMANKDRMKDGMQIKPWPEWIADHFDLEDASGKVFKLRRTNHSRLIKPHQIMGTHEFFMATRLKIGVSYTFEYVPDTDVDKRYRYQFTAPSAAQKVQYCAFKLVE